MGTTAKNKTSGKKKPLNIVLNVLLWIFLVFAFLMMVFAFASISNDYGVPMMGDKVILNVISDSMEPTIKKGDMIVGKTLTLEEKQNLSEQQIITFFADINGDGVKEVNTHRIVKKVGTGEDTYFRTKGDNSERYPVNVLDDGYNVRLDDVICTWNEGDTQIHGMGSVLGFLQSRVGFLCIVVIPLALFFIYEVVRFAMTAVKVKNDGKQLVSKDDLAEVRRQAVEEYLREHGGENADKSGESDQN